MTAEDIRDEIYGALAYAQGNNRLETIADFERENQRTLIIYLQSGKRVTVTIPVV